MWFDSCCSKTYQQMSTFILIPSSLREAAQHLRVVGQKQPASLSKADFVRAWSAVAYLYPGLHPDGFDHPESGWPRVLKRLAEEAWRRADAGDLTDEELYPSDAQWAGLYDRMTSHTPEESARRLELAQTRTERN
jgi:hypothetical protein